MIPLMARLKLFSGGLSPDLQSMEQIRRIMRPTDVPDQGLLCDLLWSDPDKVSYCYNIKRNEISSKTIRIISLIVFRLFIINIILVLLTMRS